MSSEDESTNASQISTGGGPAIGGDINTSGGDFVGRDKNIFTEEAAYNVHGLGNPYLGLRAFTYADRAIYAGREQLAQETVQQLSAPGAQQTLLFITGASGSGKSSFAQAALIPMLETHYAAYQKIVRPAVFRPSIQPMAMLADALQKLHPDLTLETLAANTPNEQINLLLIDQFEELFIQSDVSQRTPFCDFLTNLPSFETGRTHILITLRVDYLDELFAIQPLWAIAKEGVELRTMRADDLRNAIQKPLQVEHPQKRFAPELLDRLVQDAGVDAALLPLLQVTLAELWKTGKLVLSNYQSLTDAIRQRAETVYAFSDHASADPKAPRSADDQQELMSILLDLINVSADGTDRRDVRQRRTRQELAQGSAHRPRLIEELVNARLLAATNETRNGTDVEVIDIIHESLIDNWDRLRQAIEAQRQQLQRRARFKLWLGEWLRNEQQDGLLLNAIHLAEVHTLVERQDIEVQSIEGREFYQRSVEYREKTQRRQVRTFRTVAVVMGFLFLLAALAAGWGFQNLGNARQSEATAIAARVTSDANVVQKEQERERADQNANAAKLAQVNAEQQAAIARSRQLAVQSASELSNNSYESAMLLAIESGKIKDTSEAFSSVRAAIATSWHSHVVFYGDLSGVTQMMWSQDGTKILTVGDKTHIWDIATGKTLLTLERVRAATWSLDERTILTVGWGWDQPRILDATTGKQLLTVDSFGDATWNQDGSKILTISDEIRIWDAATGDQLFMIERSDQATWNQDGSKILTTSNKTAKSWDASTGKQLLVIEGAIQASWNQDGSKILTIGWDNTAHTWDAITGKELFALNCHTGKVYQAIWSRDGNKILTASDDDIACVWDADSGQQLFKLSDYTDRVYQGTWNQDGNKIVSNYSLWDAASGQKLFTFPSNAPPVQSQDGSKILTVNSSDGIFRIWDTSRGEESLMLEDVRDVMWNQSGSKILTVSNKDIVHIWDVTTGKPLLTLEGIYQATWSKDESKIFTNYADTFGVWDAISGNRLLTLEGVYQATWSPDGSKILTTNASENVRILDASNGLLLFTLEGVRNVAWSQDKGKILTFGWDNTIRIVDDVTGKPLYLLEGIRDAMWSQDKTKILTFDWGNTVHIWNASTGKSLLTLENVIQATWSQDESKILTTNDDGTICIWDVVMRKQLVKLEGRTDWINKVVWSQDGSKILTVGWDNIARIWNAVSGKLLLTLEGAHGATWSPDESKILSWNVDNALRIWDAVSGKPLLALENIRSTAWSPNESKILTLDWNDTVRIWYVDSGKELFKLEKVNQAKWNPDESKILTSNDDGTVRIWYVHIADLLEAACIRASRNFTWAEWSVYMESDYRPTCPNAPIPPDAIAAIQDEARQQIRAGQVVSATQRLDQLNGWLQVNGQFKSFGVDVQAFVADVSATATTEALSTPTFTPSPTQLTSPLGIQHTSPLPSPMITPDLMRTPAPTSPLATLKQ